MKPHVKLQGYDSRRYTVLVALKSGTVYVAGAYSYKPAAYRMAHQRSSARDQRTHRSTVVRPGESLAGAVNYVIRDLPPTRH